MESFQEAINCCALDEICTQGQKFTRSNNRIGVGFTKERLDRAMVNQKVMELFLGAVYHAFPTLKSDHSPLLLILSCFSHINSKK